MTDVVFRAKPAVINLEWWAGDGFTVRVDYAVDMTGAVFVAQLRAAVLDSDIAETFAINDDDAATGIILATLTAAETRALLVDGARSWRGVWDMQCTQPGAEPRTHFAGTAVCTLDVTR